MNSVGLSLVVFFAVFGASQAIKCYECTTKTNGLCWNGFTRADFMVECPLNGCLKITKDTIIVRTCGSMFVGDTCDEHICNCHSNLCNHAMTPSLPTTAVTLTIIGAVASRLME